MNKENKYKLIDTSASTFKIISEPDMGKFTYLPNWLNNVSYRYNKEFKGEFPSTYYHYKRGTVIRVDFGINMGSEFCGPHFAIVLDKKDTARKRTLTVIPLTSKEKKGRFSLGKEIFNQTVSLLTLNLASLEKEAKILQTHNKEDVGYSEDHDKLTTKLKELKKVITVYRKYDKNSFVRLSDITTISKFRINRINQFDPSGQIQLTGEQMKSIRECQILCVNRKASRPFFKT